MAVCKECGANVALDENFCGGCGARVEDNGSSEVTPAGDLAKDPGIGSSTWGPPKEADSNTGEVESPGATSRAGDGSRRKTKPKALSAGKTLNNRYEIEGESAAAEWALSIWQR